MWEKIKEQWKKIQHQIKNVEIHYLKMMGFNLKMGILWMIRAFIVGLVVGGFSSVFTLGLGWVNETRMRYPFLLFLLPVGGLLIVWLYRLCGMERPISSASAWMECAARCCSMRWRKRGSMCRLEAPAPRTNLPSAGH